MKPATALVALPLLAALAGCITYRTVDDGIVRARIGETVQVGPATIQPTALLEDSRCPAGVQCVWAGRVRIAAEMNGTRTEMTLGQPVSTAGGSIVLAEAYPQARKDTTYYPDEYRFGFSAQR